MEALLTKLYEQNGLTKEEIVYFLQHLTPELKKRLFLLADETRKRHYNKSVFMRGLIEFSNFCKQDCMYCGLRRSNANVDRYRLSEE